MVEIVRSVRDTRIVGTDAGADGPLLQQLATDGSGRSYKVADPMVLPKVFVREVELRLSTTP